MNYVCGQFIGVRRDVLFSLRQVFRDARCVRLFDEAEREGCFDAGVRMRLGILCGAGRRENLQP